MATQGLFMNPEDVGDARLMQLAQMDPNQRLFLQAARSGQQLGQGLGSLFGQDVRDPAVIRATKMRELAAKYGVNTAESLDKIASDLQTSGDFDMAMQIKAKADEMRKSSTELKLKQAQTAKAERPSEGTLSERNRQIISKAEIKLAGGQPLTPEETSAVRWMVAQETKPKAFRDADTGELITIQPLDLQQAAPNIFNFLQGGKQQTSPLPAGVPAEVGQITSPAPGITVTKVGEGKGPDASTLKELGTIEANITKLNKSVTNLSSIDSQINTLDLGLLENWARGGLAGVGINTKDRTTFDKLKRTMLAEANNLLLLAKGAQTEGDAQRARDQIADENTWKNKEALKQAFADLRQTHKDTLDALDAQKTVLTSKGKSLTQKPTTAPPTTVGGDNEAKIAKFMAANPKMNREQVVSNMKRMGFLPANF